MFAISVSLKNNIADRLKAVSADLKNVLFAKGDCSCSGSCGTYVQPCGCCAYHSGKDN